MRPGVQAPTRRTRRPHAATAGAIGRTDYTLCNIVAMPNDKTLNCAGCRYAAYTGSDSSNFVPPTSAHPGGVNLLFCDGSVKFIKDSINRVTWWAIGTMGER